MKKLIAILGITQLLAVAGIVASQGHGASRPVANQQCVYYGVGDDMHETCVPVPW